MIYLLNCIQYELLNLFSAQLRTDKKYNPYIDFRYFVIQCTRYLLCAKNKSPTEYPLLSASVYLPGFHIFHLKSDYFSILFCAIKGDERISVLIGHIEL